MVSGYSVIVVDNDALNSLLVWSKRTTSMRIKIGLTSTAATFIPAVTSTLSEDVRLRNGMA